jgi:hypothetical protein
MFTRDHTSGAKAPLIFVGFIGTTEVVPFQNLGTADFFRTL